MYAICFKRERSDGTSPAFPASHSWNQVLSGLPAHGSPGNSVKHLSHQPAGLEPLTILCPGFQLPHWKNLFSRYIGYSFTFCLLRSSSLPLIWSCCSETLPRIHPNYSLLLTNPARHRNPQPRLLNSPTRMAS